jgi:hypothetical protein
MATLPAYVKILFDQYAEEKESGILRTEFENGPPRQAKFKSRTLKTRSVRLFIDTNANFQAFETWFREDLEQGALFFDFTDPVTNQTTQGRFVSGVYTARPLSSSMNVWQVECQIESWSA